MNKPLLILACMSSVASTGCIGLIGIGLGAVTESRAAKKEETHYFTELNKKFDKLDEKYATVGTEIESLEEANDDWMNLYRSIEAYRENDYFGSKRIGSCVKSRKDNEHCKNALVLRGKVAGKIADTLHAAIEAEPVVTTTFPLRDIVYAQSYADIAAAVDIEKSLETAVPKWNAFYAKRLAKLGGAEVMTKKANQGMCFFSDSSRPADVMPRFAVSKSADELHVRCVTPQAISSYDRSQQDSVQIRLANSDNGQIEIDSLPGDSASASQGFDAEVRMAELRKQAMKGARGEHDAADGDDAGDPAWRFVLADVQYLAFKKVGDRVEESGNGVRVQDDIRTSTLASGFAIIDTKGTLFADVDTGETPAADEETAEASDTDADTEQPAPKARKHKKSKSHKAKKSKRSRAARRTSRH